MWPEDPPVPRATKIEKLFFNILLTIMILAGLVYGGMKLFEIDHAFRKAAVVKQVVQITRAVEVFKEMYNALPGDMPNAGKFLQGCTGRNGKNCNPVRPTAGDGIIGQLDLTKSWKAQFPNKTHLPPSSASDESVLFWTHLLLANTIGGVTDEGIQNSIAYSVGRTHPEARFGGVFVVGHLDGAPLPKTLSPNSSGIKGTVLLQVSDKTLRGEAELNDEDQQALTPLRAVQIDRKMDDGRAGTGYVQAFGSADCFDANGDYNETSQKKSCGLIFRIAD